MEDKMAHKKAWVIRNGHDSRVNGSIKCGRRDSGNILVRQHGTKSIRMECGRGRITPSSRLRTVRFYETLPNERKSSCRRCRIERR